MRTVEETDINACVPNMLRKSLLDFWVRIVDILQVSKEL